MNTVKFPSVRLFAAPDTLQKRSKENFPAGQAYPDQDQQHPPHPFATLSHFRTANIPPTPKRKFPSSQKEKSDSPRLPQSASAIKHWRTKGQNLKRRHRGQTAPQL